MVNRASPISIGLLGLLGLYGAVVTAGSSCRCFPGDKCWPSAEEWGALNATVSGRLIASVPIGTPCHVPNYDEAKCKFIQDNWHDPALQ